MPHFFFAVGFAYRLTFLRCREAAGPREAYRRAVIRNLGLLHLLLSHPFYYDWALSRRVIDGGPLGLLSWTIPTLAGSLTYDAIHARGPARSLKPLLGWSAFLMLVGYAISCLNLVDQPRPGGGLGAYLIEPPFVPPSMPVDIWTMITYIFLRALERRGIFLRL